MARNRVGSKMANRRMTDGHTPLCGDYFGDLQLAAVSLSYAGLFLQGVAYTLGRRSFLGHLSGSQTERLPLWMKKPSCAAAFVIFHFTGSFVTYTRNAFNAYPRLNDSFLLASRVDSTFKEIQMKARE